MKSYTFNRVLGLKFLYENFPYLYNDKRIKLYFVSSKNDLMNLDVGEQKFDTFVLKRSANKMFINDIQYKDNRFFSSLQELKQGCLDLEDIFDFCVECHKFKEGENYYSDRLAIAQFTTKLVSDSCDRISFIPSKVDGVNTRDNEPYVEVEFTSDYGNIYHIKEYKKDMILLNNFDNYTISYLITKIHLIIDKIRDYLIELDCHDDFQLIIRIDSYQNLLPIDFRTPSSWVKVNK